MMANVNYIESDVRSIIQKLRLLPIELAEQKRKQILKDAAKPVVKAAKKNVKDATETIERYTDGQVVASYAPGNLRRSIQTLNFKSSNAIFVGPRIAKGSSKGAFRGNRVDAYYAHIIEKGGFRGKRKKRGGNPEYSGGAKYVQGTHFLEKAYNATKEEVKEKIYQGVEKALNDYIRKVQRLGF